MALEHCPACGGEAGDTLLAWESMPVNCHRLHSSRERAIAAPRGTIQLTGCGNCGLIWNHRFDASLAAYVPGYDNPLDHSPTFARWQAGRAAELVERYRLGEGSVLEIGCGRGGFLRALLASGAREAIAFEPAWDPSWPTPDQTEIVPGTFDRTRLQTAPTLVIARHVLEHLADPGAFLRMLRELDAPLMLEVPNGDRLAEAAGIWDVIYEHATHFTEASLTHLLRSAGYRVRQVGHDFGGQFLSVEATPEGTPVTWSEGIDAAPAIHDSLAAVARALAGHRWLIWGMGSKGVTLVNRVRPDTVAGVVDLNPDKRGRFVPGSGHRILGPADVRERAPDRILVMNPLYRAEVVETVRSLGLACPVIPIDALLAEPAHG